MNNTPLQNQRAKGVRIGVMVFIIVLLTDVDMQREYYRRRNEAKLAEQLAKA